MCVLSFRINREYFILRSVDEMMFKKKNECSNIYDYSSVGY